MLSSPWVSKQVKPSLSFFASFFSLFFFSNRAREDKMHGLGRNIIVLLFEPVVGANGGSQWWMEGLIDD